MDATMEALQADLLLLDSKDPLRKFLDYISWAEIHHPGHASIYATTEKAVRLLRNDHRYYNNEQFIRLWILVAKRQQDPSELFRYLTEKQIGAKMALFYEEYSLLFHNRPDEAERVLLAGIERNAMPLDRLKLKYQELRAQNARLVFVVYLE
jgi:checkpoint serine/threonine-protein kinase